ncbi:MAG: 3-dehydro-L-gulonate 2-dehydrogenase [Ignavibacteriales bacterium]|nr:3-dehydro-L-gulonate 2-dehydrogenase [Ignavibacteriales bacterium]
MDELDREFQRVLLTIGFESQKAKLCAHIFAENTLVGVNTHGINRFPRFVRYVLDGFVKPHAEPQLKHKAGALEQWDGCLGPGPLNALFCTKRGMEIARETGIGCVALSNTNHWMRGGYYGWEAAKSGFVFIAWTNTTANMPAWGAVDCRLGNNPLVLAVPHGDDAIVLDMAMSQFSYGSVELHDLRKSNLPLPGGYDTQGVLTTDPSAILESRRLLPMGYWKGSGLAVMLDLVAAIFAGGDSTHEISTREAEYAISQVYILVDPSRLSNNGTIAETVSGIMNDLHGSVSAPGVENVLFPGERVHKTRIENLTHGIPIDKSVWLEIQQL